MLRPVWTQGTLNLGLHTALVFQMPSQTGVIVVDLAAILARIGHLPAIQRGHRACICKIKKHRSIRLENRSRIRRQLAVHALSARTEIIQTFAMKLTKSHLQKYENIHITSCKYTVPLFCSTSMHDYIIISFSADIGIYNERISYVKCLMGGYVCSIFIDLVIDSQITLTGIGVL